MSFDPIGLMTDGHASGYNTVLAFCPARVLVLDDEGRALQGATVTFGSVEVTTDENGLTAWREFPAGEYLFEVAKADYRSVSGPVTLEHRVSWVVIIEYVGVLARHFGMRSVGAADSRSAGVSSADEASRSCDVDEVRSRGPRRLS